MNPISAITGVIVALAPFISQRPADERPLYAVVGLVFVLYAGGLLEPDMPLTGRYERRPGAVDLSGLLREIEDARLEEAARLQRMA